MNNIPDYSIFIKNPYLLSQFLDTQVADLVGVTTDQFNELETTFWGLINGLMLKNAIGDQLDIIGSEVGLARNGLGDSDYRALLYIQCLLNASCGEPEDILTMLNSFLVGITNIVLAFIYPAKIAIMQDSSFTVQQLFDDILPLLPSGVDLGISQYVITSDEYSLETEDGFDIITEAGDLIMSEGEDSGNDKVITEAGDYVIADAWLQVF